MTTSANPLRASGLELPASLYTFKGKNHPQVLKIGKESDECIWQTFMATHRIMHLFRPDYFMIYKFSTSSVLYQQNINLDLGTNDVTANRIMDYLAPADLAHFNCMDKVMCQMTRDRKLQPLDYIFKLCGNIECPNQNLKRIMRTSFLIHCSTTGLPELGFFCVHDVTSMVSSIKPGNYDITLEPCHAHLEEELVQRLTTCKPKQYEITNRERDILSCVDKGMSSKEIASFLFISKATVDTHRQNMLRKWELPNTASLLKKAREEDRI